MTLGSLLAEWGLDVAVQQFGRRLAVYLFLAGGATLVLTRTKALQKWRIQDATPSTRASLKAIMLSAQTFAIWALMGLGVAWMARAGWTRLYWDVSEYGWGYAALSVGLLVVLQDTYFYWTHRLLHHPVLYKKVHATHHQFSTPSPWTSFAMHPLDAVVQQLFFMLFALMIPIHGGALALGALLLMTGVINLHAGYELMPRCLHSTALARWLTTSTHHNLHHLRFTGNYGASLRIWDRLMGTEAADYEARFTAVKDGQRVRRKAERNEWRQ